MAKLASIQIHSLLARVEDRPLIKLKDEYVSSLPEDLEDQGESALTGRTVKDLNRLGETHGF
jgi:hypothetical protein